MTREPDFTFLALTKAERRQQVPESEEVASMKSPKMEQPEK